MENVNEVEPTVTNNGNSTTVKMSLGPHILGVDARLEVETTFQHGEYDQEYETQLTLAKVNTLAAATEKLDQNVAALRSIVSNIAKQGYVSVVDLTQPMPGSAASSAPVTGSNAQAVTQAVNGAPVAQGDWITIPNRNPAWGAIKALSPVVFPKEKVEQAFRERMQADGLNAAMFDIYDERTQQAASNAAQLKLNKNYKNLLRDVFLADNITTVYRGKFEPNVGLIIEPTKEWANIIKSGGGPFRAQGQVTQSEPAQPVYEPEPAPVNQVNQVNPFG